jgi:uncharacterized protein YbjT (DUF2867 family)
MIVITAPTGNIGHQVLSNILDCGEPIRVIARDPAKLSAATRSRVEVVEGSHGDLDVVTRAFAGADAVFWLLPPNPQAPSLEAAYVDFTRPACQAFNTQSVKRVVTVTALGRGSHDDTGYVAASLAMDDLIASSGVAFRALAMPSFMDNMLNQVDAIKNQGMFYSPISADLKLPTVATRDIAAVAAKLLVDNTWTGQSEVPLLGAEDLSNNDMAWIISDVLGKRVGFQQISGEDFRARLTGFGMSEPMAQGMLDMMVAKNEGLDNAEPRTAQATTPTTFRQWCEDVLKPAVLA